MTDDSANMLDKTFDPATIEAKWYRHWEDTGLFRPERPDATPFTIVNPPPNVTGSLHIGHALDNTLQDVVIRYERLRGKDALWVVGTDHAGIATQMVVERQMEAKQDKRTNYTREGFVEKVWEWKAESGGTITRQLRRLGCSMDWSREQFTMDPHFTKAVVKVFVDLHKQGLIYRDKRLVNWDPRLKTAISDLEVETREIDGKFWHFKYPLSDGSGHISVATTRPETMLADMLVAVNPSDERYKPLLARGATVILPITGREIPIVADEHADPELGSGAVKITPGHDFNDFEVGKRAGIKAGDMLNMLDAEAHVCQTADGLIPAQLIGTDRFEARKRVVELLDEDGLLEKIEDRVIQTPYGDRGGVVIEPWLTDQWYVDAETLAKAPMEAVRSGAIEIVPKTWEKTFFNWMENIQPWCVSRQLWWGHRIPAWFGPKKLLDGSLIVSPKSREGREIFVAETEAAAEAAARHFYGDEYKIELLDHPTTSEDYLSADESTIYIFRDEDVLDTWFSSALWPFATLGWPDEEKPSPRQGRGLGEGNALQSDAPALPLAPTLSPEGERETLLSRHYPNDLLISGFDILFFWDARMAMQGLHFMKEVPWKRLYLHGLVRAADGQKMSKSKGNVVDPLGLIDQYGADALRFFMAAMESQGRDVKMDEKRVEGYRNFATKLWNAARFCQSNGIGASQSVAAPVATSAVNRWIISEVIETVAALDKAMADLRFDAAANTIYQFAWSQFCDWYIELIKGQFDEETKAVAGWVLDQILVMLHPFMPFVTEELWSKMGERPYELIVAQWPEPAAQVDSQAKAEVEWLIALISGIRGARTELNVPPSAKLPLMVPTEEPLQLPGRISRNLASLERLARVSEARPLQPIEVTIHDGATSTDNYEARLVAQRGAIQVIVDGVTYTIPLEGVIDIASEKARLEKALATSVKERDSIGKRLDNPAFVEKAKPEAVEKAKADHAAHAAEAERLQAALARLG
ncbi:valyl-tRNA synthetase [Novosphingobium chloroacetimidivorans]|uniref:Valine--tRNA ligase n=1 Tax=Novosphingobium chloroacetimidivorans TaxID=1428314 RepID=A0A7W7KEW3_9SPHN|nr:valine--tRNA ligase [Novosphingobium chloroacetimidivorans]MBB4860979.1 valyl-tRNA synthetase [Novosphingobium chloroacetimidivorans]